MSLIEAAGIGGPRHITGSGGEGKAVFVEASRRSGRDHAAPQRLGPVCFSARGRSSRLTLRVFGLDCRIDKFCGRSRYCRRLGAAQIPLRRLCDFDDVRRRSRRPFRGKPLLDGAYGLGSIEPETWVVVRAVRARRPIGRPVQSRALRADGLLAGLPTGHRSGRTGFGRYPRSVETGGAGGGRILPALRPDPSGWKRLAVRGAGTVHIDLRRPGTDLDRSFGRPGGPAA